MRRPGASILPCILAALVVGCTESPAGDQTAGPPFTPSLDAAEQTEVLVLGTPHLASLEDRYAPGMLEPLLVRLEAYAPDAIGLESIPPAALADMVDRPEFDQVVFQFAEKRAEWGERLQAELGLAWHEAADSAEALLALDRSSSLEAAARQELILLLMAAYDDLGAQLHWAYLTPDVVGPESPLPDSLQAYLGREARSQNERIALGIELARRLGHRRLDYIDDHHDKDLFLEIAPTMIEQLKGNEEYRSALSSPFLDDSNARLEQAAADGDLLPYYRFVNTSEHGAADAAAQWDVWLRTGLESGLDRARLALWEVRNLNMTSHIRRATATIPGGRMLVIVGYAHRPFLEAYLTPMADVRLLRFSDLEDRAAS